MTSVYRYALGPDRHAGRRHSHKAVLAVGDGRTECREGRCWYRPKRCAHATAQLKLFAILLPGVVKKHTGTRASIGQIRARVSRQQRGYAMNRLVTGLIRGALVGVCAMVGVLVMGAPRLAHAQTATSEAAAAATPNSPAEEIVITGTRRTDRTVIDSASPIDVITGT